jgi:hypothetical protein
MQEPDEEPTDLDRTLWETYEEMWNKDGVGQNVASIDLPAKVHDALEAYAKERVVDRADLFSLAISGG